MDSAEDEDAMSLKTIRSRLRVTQAEVASASDVDQATISRIEARAGGSPNMTTLLQIQRGLRRLAKLKKIDVAIFINDIYRGDIDRTAKDEVSE